jgi:hypothetical protein
LRRTRPCRDNPFQRAAVRSGGRRIRRGVVTSGIATELWTSGRRSRTAAKLLSEEFAFNEARLELVVISDEAGASYELRFRSADWRDNRDAFLIGASPSAGQAVSRWYARLAILGDMVRHDTGPPREELIALFTQAQQAVERVGKFRTNGASPERRRPDDSRGPVSSTRV